MSRPATQREIEAEVQTLQVRFSLDPQRISPDERRSLELSAFATLQQRFGGRPWFLGLKVSRGE